MIVQRLMMRSAQCEAHGVWGQVVISKAPVGVGLESGSGIARRMRQFSVGFIFGKILTLAVPGAGMLLSAVEAEPERALAVDSIVGSADYFANEVVAALGGDAAAGLP